MIKNFTLQDLEDFKHNFSIFYQQRKRVRALQNFVNATSFRYEAYLFMIEQSLKEKFLDKQEATFLHYMIKKTGLNKIKYSTWYYKKKKIKRLVIGNQLYMDFDKIQPIPQINIPIHIINHSTFTNTNNSYSGL